MTIWNLATGARVRVFGEESKLVRAVAFARDGKALAAAADDGTVKLYDPVTGTLGASFRSRSPVRSMAFTCDARMLATGHDDGSARLWDITERAEVARLTGHRGAIFSIAFTPDGKNLVTASKDETLRLWPTEQQTLETARFTGHDGWVTALAVSPGERLLSASWDGTIRVWELNTRAELGRLEGHRDRVLALAASVDGTRALSGGSDRTVPLLGH